jgi:hypothetical protein
MGKTPPEPPVGATRNPVPKPEPAGAREARLKAALKANMARRKTQAAARRIPDAANDTEG